MTGKVISFENGVERYRKIAEEHAEKGDFSSALGFLFTAKGLSSSLEVLTDIADCYADMGLLELSNHYWFKYLDRAPKEKQGVAFEELAINFFYMDDYLASSYYFHQKLTVDGFITKENLDKDILDFFSGEEMKKHAYRVVYPYERADYTFEQKNAKHAMAVGNFDAAVKILSAIPEECLDEETSGDLAVSYFMSNNLDEAANVCRKSIASLGDNVTAYCNLATVYDMKSDFEKSKYYYEKALSLRKGAKDEEYKIATCAIEREDHQVVKECLEKILFDRPYDLAMRYFYGCALVNVGDYEGASKAFSIAYRANPSDLLYKYYAELSLKLVDGCENKECAIPLRYLKALPQKTEKKREKRIKELIKDPSKIASALKNPKTFETVEWGLKYGSNDVARASAYLLSSLYNKKAKKVMLDAIMDFGVASEIKRVIVYALIVNGFKERFGMLVGNFYVKVKPKKLSFEKKFGSGAYLSAYALCMSRLAFLDVEELDKIAEAAESVYEKLSCIFTESDVTNDDLAALMLYACGYKRFKKDSEILAVFNIGKDRLRNLKIVYNGGEE